MKQRKVLNTGFIKLQDAHDQAVAFTFRIKSPMFIYSSFFEKRLGTLHKSPTKHLEFYTPAHYQSKDGVILPNEVCNTLSTKFQNFHIWLYNFYKKILEYQLHPQQVDMLLPQSIFTEFYWRLDIVEFQNFLGSYHGDPRYEIQQYVKAMKDLVVEQAPWAIEFLKGL